MTRNVKQRTGLSQYQYNDLRAKVLFEQDFLCVKCKSIITHNKGSKSLHHIDGNPKHNQRSNLLVLCSKCHKFPHGYDKRKRNWQKRSYEKYGRVVPYQPRYFMYGVEVEEEE